MRNIFCFDVECMGLYGDAFAVGGGLYHKEANENGRIYPKPLAEFMIMCDPKECLIVDKGSPEWIKANIPKDMTPNCNSLYDLRNLFWKEYMRAKSMDSIILTDCAFPCETSFLAKCISDDKSNRSMNGPYPILDLSNILWMLKKNPIGTYDRNEKELPVHNPLHDARQTVRLFVEHLGKDFEPFLS